MIDVEVAFYRLYSARCELMSTEERLRVSILASNQERGLQIY